MTDALNDEAEGGDPRGDPGRPLGKPDEIAAAVVSIWPPEAAYVTGQTLHVNGGMAMI